MTEPLVSIITPLYNAELFIEGTISSVIAQTYKNWEMIIVDDFSTDNGYLLVENYVERDCRIKLIRLTEKNGAAKARNIAIKSAKGRYIAFLDADDLWKPHKLEIQVKFMKEKGILLSYSSYDLIDKNNHKIGSYHAKACTTYKDMLKTSRIGCLTAVYDAEKLGKIYMPEIKKGQDYALWLKILKLSTFAEGIRDSLACYRIQKKSLSSSKFDSARYQWKTYRTIEGLAFYKSIYYFIYYTINGFIKYKR